MCSCRWELFLPVSNATHLFPAHGSRNTKIIMWSHSWKSRKLCCFFCSTRIVRVVRRGHYLDWFAEPQELTRKYTSRQQISAAKNKDLVSLCRSGIIQSEYHHCNRLTIQLKPNFLRNQPHQSRKRERGKVIVKNRSLIVIIHCLKMITQGWTK